ncbi:MAG: pilin [Candidatus Nealsonbacteria bacterium]|nr:pilin [Candidatus Nealsonbacteria bacterium]
MAKKCTTDAECAPARCVDEKCVKTLEIVYPKVPGATATPETVATGLPEYVNYIFRFAVIVIGLIIFGVLVYNGVIYLTSVGDPSKMTDARTGIFAGFLGAIILLSAYLIFNTINPQLTILKMEEVPALKPIVFPGIYICANKVDDIEGVLNKYLQGDRVEAVEELRKIIEDKICLKANFSGNFENFEVSANNNTFFVIPAEESKYDSDKATTTTKYVSKYGLILHEKDNFSGRCFLAFQENDKIYASSSKEEFKPISGNFDKLPSDFKARSFTLFKEPDPEPAPAAQGVILYNCLSYDQTGCAKDVTLKEAPFNTGGADMRQVTKSGLGELAQNTRSVKIDPKGSFLALLYEKDDFEGKCEVISSNVVDLTQHPIGRCPTDLAGAGCNVIGIWIYSLGGLLSNPYCQPCIQSMTVIKGLRL